MATVKIIKPHETTETSESRRGVVVVTPGTVMGTVTHLGYRTMSKMEKLIGRRLRPLPVGRPRKKRGKK